MTFKRAILTTVFALAFVSPSDAKSKQIPAPNLPWKDGEVLIVNKDGNSRMGVYNDGSSVYFMISPQLTNLTTHFTSWRVVCNQDAMNDEVNCMVISDPARFGVFFKEGEEQPVGVKILEHDFPGEDAMIRVGDAKPFTSNPDGWVFDPKLVEQIRRGGIIKTRIMIFPKKSYDDNETRRPVVDFDEAVSLMRHMQANFGKISFEPR